jgi:hypothetical protein
LFGGDLQVNVVSEHGGVPPTFLGVPCRPAEELAQPQRDVLRVVLVDVREHRAKDRVGVHVPVEDFGQPLERRGPTGPFVQTGFLIATL